MNNITCSLCQFLVLARYKHTPASGNCAYSVLVTAVHGDWSAMVWTNTKKNYVVNVLGFIVQDLAFALTLSIRVETAAVARDSSCSSPNSHRWWCTSKRTKTFPFLYPCLPSNPCLFLSYEWSWNGESPQHIGASNTICKKQFLSQLLNFWTPVSWHHN